MDVSVIIPTYNRLWCLPKAIESCRHTQCQTEIIVVDDGSSDGTWEWLQTQPDIISLRQDNWGKCWAVNRGFTFAQGKYIRFLDSDDWLCPEAIDRQFELTITQETDVVVGGYEVYSQEGTLLRQVYWNDCDDFVAQQLGECDSSHYSAYLFRREFLKDIPHRPDYAWRDDRLLIIEVAIANPKVAVYPQPTFCHRHHSQTRLQFQQGMTAVATNLQHLTLYKKCLSKLAARDQLTPRRRKASCKILWSLAHWIAYTHLHEACEVVDWIYQLDPDFQPPEPGLLGKLYTYLGFRHTENLLWLRRNILTLFGKRSNIKYHDFSV
ncbi:glycosyltransferase [Scytonema sp. UIC 10036]|uniref:glycosyltransferase family 2 protein n=1 Tax=Scytonema sp. UIC 10036 TaxID=2304196 RepID=UPI0012DAB647|nr:glycosyltransferase family 2 protein [Scytonema sp. UIC 10036]MUG94044.1 glycosyltransferase [Scytonema sp. UIC 10036]